jgi:hypothetical protein
MSNKKVEYDVLHIPYDKINFLRKRWFLFLTLLLFVPATFIIAATGKIYGKVKNETVVFHPSFNKRVMIISGVFFCLGIFRVFMSL